MTETRVNVAVVGAGLASAPHLESLLALRDHVAVRSVVARSAERAGAFAARFPGARVELDLDAALADEQLDGVLLLTPPDTHLQLGTRIANAGKHLLVEKPATITTAQARELVAVCTARGVTAAAVLQHRTRPAARQLRELLHAGALGEVHSACVSVPWWRPQSYYDEPGRGSMARDGGGVLMTQAIHTLDLLIWMMGLPREVFAYAITSRAHRMDCEDTVAGAMHYADGCVASLFASTAIVPGYPERIDISGSKGTATLSAGKLSVAFADGTALTEGEEAAFGAGANPMAFSHQAHQTIIANFIDAIAHGAEPVASLRSALDVQLLIDALIASSDNHQPTPVRPGPTP